MFCFFFCFSVSLFFHFVCLLVQYCPTTNNKLTNSITTQTQTTPPNQTSVIQSTKSYQNGKSTVAHNNAQTMVTTSTTTNSAVINADNHAHQQELKNTS